MDYDKLAEMYLNNTWRANLSIVGADGLPPTSVAGNVVRASTSLKLSLRLPPSAPAQETEAKLIEVLQKDVPHNAKVTVTSSCQPGQGWCMKDMAPWFS